LIAARLPGRTANDVKNFWHTHLRKKIVSETKEKKEKEKPKETMKAHEVIKPQPRIFSTHSSWLNRKHVNFVSQPMLASNKDGNVSRKHVKFVSQPMLAANKDGSVSRKHVNFVSQPMLASNKDGDDRETMVTYQNGRDCASASQPSIDNVPIPCALWSDNLWNLGEQLGSEKTGPGSSLQEENFNMEFLNVDDSLWNSNLCDFDSLWDLY